MHLTWRNVAPGAGPPICTSLLAEEAAELAALAKGKRVLETGSAHGFSAVTMALAGAEHVTAIDNHAGNTWLGDTRTTMEGNLAAYGVADRVTIVAADSHAGLAALKAEDAKFGLIFIDGDHSMSGALGDIDGALQLLDKDAVLAVHDYGETCCCPDVRRAVDAALGWMETRAAGTRPPREVGTLWLKQF